MIRTGVIAHNPVRYCAGSERHSRGPVSRAEERLTRGPREALKVRIHRLAIAAIGRKVDYYGSRSVGRAYPVLDRKRFGGYLVRCPSHLVARWLKK